MLLSGLLLAAAAVALTVVAGRHALAAAELTEQARGRLAAVQAADDTSLDDAVAELREASRLLTGAQERLAGPSVDLVARVPVLGRSWAAERAVVDAADAAVEAALVAAEAVPSLRRAGGGVDLDALGRLGARLTPRAERATGALARLRTTRTALTPGRVGEAVADAQAELGPLVDGMRAAAAAAEATPVLLGGNAPRPVLVGLLNNAELRGTGGYFSAFATGTARDGALELTGFRDPTQVNDPPERARPVPAPAEYREDYGPFLGDTTLWRMCNLSPDTPDSAQVCAEAAQVLLGQRPETVVLLDVVAVAELVDLAGERVRLPSGEQVGGDALLEALLVDAYDDAAAEGRGGQDRRQAELRAAAGEVATRVLGSADLDPAAAVRLLRRLVSGRHLALWSADPDAQERLVAAGAAGRLDAGDGDLVHVSVNNLTANKLDHYVRREVEQQVVVDEGQAAVVQTVRLTSIAPDGLVPYVLGTRQPGVSDLRVELSTSPRARVESLTVDGREARAEARPGARRTRVVTYVTLARGATVELRLRYSLPVAEGGYRVSLVPQALSVPARLRVSVRSQDGALTVPEGFEPAGASVVLSDESWTRRRDVDVRPRPERAWVRAWDTVRDFWSSPVPRP